MCFSIHIFSFVKYSFIPFAHLKMEVLGGGRVSWDEVREWHGHIYTTKCKIDS